MAILASCLPVPLQPECSPDGAPHNPGQAWVATSPAPDSIAFHPGYLLTPELAELHILSPELRPRNSRTPNSGHKPHGNPFWMRCIQVEI
jgi:hypothetical protein